MNRIVASDWRNRTPGMLDLMLLLGAWGPCPETCPPFCQGDLNGDCTVGRLQTGDWPPKKQAGTFGAPA